MPEKKRKGGDVPLSPVNPMKAGSGDDVGEDVESESCFISSPSPLRSCDEADDDDGDVRDDWKGPDLNTEERRRRDEKARDMADRRSFYVFYMEFDRKDWTEDDEEAAFREHVMKMRRNEKFLGDAEKRAREPFVESCQWMCIPTRPDSAEGRTVGNADWLRRVTKKEKDRHYFRSYADVGHSLFDESLGEIYVPVDEKYCHVLMAFGAIRRHYPVYADYIHHSLCTSRVACRHGEYSLIEAIVDQHANMLMRDTERYTKCAMRDGSRYALARWRDWYIGKHGESQLKSTIGNSADVLFLDFYTVFSDSLTVAEKAVARYRSKEGFWWDELPDEKKRECDKRADPYLREEKFCPF